MKKIGYIYKITNSKGAIYIGCTKNIKTREKSYRYNSCKSQTLIYNSIKKHGWDSHTCGYIWEYKNEIQKVA